MALNWQSGRFPGLMALAVSALGSGTMSSAQVLDEIVVTAQRRVQDLGDVPISVSVVSGEKIKESGIQDPEQLSWYVPNFHVARAPIADFINIRGIQSGGELGFEQSVATFVDDVYRGRGAQARWALVDIERVEILRGPQPALFGNNAVAGAVNVSTARPTEALDAELSLSYNPEFEETELQGHVSGPLSENVSARLSLLSRRMDEGWILNTSYGRNIPVTDEIFGRAALTWDVSDRTLVEFKLEAGEFEEIGQPWVILEAGPLSPILDAAGVPTGKGYETAMGNSGFPLLGFPPDPVLDFGSNNHYDGDMQESRLKLEHSLANGSVITGIAGYSAYELLRFLDVDFGPMPLIRYDDYEEFEQHSLELRLTSDTGGAFEYIVGLYLQDKEMVVSGLSQFNVANIGTLLGSSCAAFPGSAGAIVVGDPIATAVGVAALPGSTAGIANACGQSALSQALVPQGIIGVGRYGFLDQSTETIAAFTQLTWNVSGDFRTTLGVRYTDEQKSASQGAYATDFVARSTLPLVDQSLANPQALAAFTLGEFTAHGFIPTDPGMSRNDNDLTWSLTAQWNVTDDAMLYASAATGFKSGGFNSFYMGLPQGLGADSLDVPFEDEQVLSYEVGAKLTLLDGAAEINLAAFHMSYEDLQVTVFSGNTTFIVQNAADATTRGLELDGRWQATDGLMLQGAIGYLDAAYDVFPNQGCTAEQFLGFRESAFQAALAGGDAVAAGVASLVINNQVCAAAGVNDLQGRAGPHSPAWSASIVADYRLQIGQYELAGILDINWSDDVYRTDDLDPLSFQEAYTKVNAVLSFGPGDGTWDVALVGRNLTDETTISWENDTPLFVGAHEAMIDQPRNVAVRARFRF